MRQRRCVVVAGFPRSGTSWLAKGLSFAPGFTYYREPDNFNFVPGAEERFRQPLPRPPSTTTPPTGVP